MSDNLVEMKRAVKDIYAIYSLYIGLSSCPFAPVDEVQNVSLFIQLLSNNNNITCGFIAFSVNHDLVLFKEPEPEPSAIITLIGVLCENHCVNGQLRVVPFWDFTVLAVCP